MRTKQLDRDWQRAWSYPRETPRCMASNDEDPMGSPQSEGYSHSISRPMFCDVVGQFNSLPDGLMRESIDEGFFADVVAATRKMQLDFKPASKLDLPALTWNSLQHVHTYFADAWLGIVVRRWQTRSLAPQTRSELAVLNIALSLLRLALNDPSQRYHDSTVQAIVCLSSSLPSDAHKFDPVPLPKQSNFTTWRLLHTATGMDFSEHHFDGITAILHARGGIQTLTNPEVALGLSFQDINAATRKLGRPRFPFAATCPILVEDSHLLGTPSMQSSLYSHSTTLNSSQGEEQRSMTQIDWPNICCIDVQPARVWTYMSDLVEILEEYMAGSPRRNSEDLMMDQCGYVQHCLLSLPPADKLDHRDHGKRSQTRSPASSSGASVSNLSPPNLHVYETARLACIAFSHLVTRPTAASLFPRLILTQKLLATLDSITNTVSAAEAQMAFWAAFLGAILAIGLATRQRLVSCIATWATHPMVQVIGWQGVKEVVKKFIWHDQTNDGDALVVWVEVQGLSWGRRICR